MDEACPEQSRSDGGVGGFRRTRYRGLERTGLAGYLVATAYNLARMAKLLARPRAKAARGPWLSDPPRAAWVQ